MATEAEIFANAILNQFKIRKGRIVSPGKFEGERIYMPWFYEQYLNGCADDNGQAITVAITQDDKIAFPELKRRNRVRFRICDQGFVTEY